MARPVNSDDDHRLFTAHVARGRILYRIHFLVFLVALFSLLYYRLTNISTTHPVLWLAVLTAEFLFAAFWVLQQSFRWSPTFYHTYLDRLPTVDKLPSVDAFVCTADPVREPPELVANTLLSLMALEYDKSKLACYVSDDGGSEMTFYGMFLASVFARDWLPFCRKYEVDPPAPESYFAEQKEAGVGGDSGSFLQDYVDIKRKYVDMKSKIAEATKTWSVPDEMRKRHKGFNEWNSEVKSRDHQPIVEVLLRGNGEDKDSSGHSMPTLVYVSREKRPDHSHNYKAGALNSLNRVSSVISNAEIMINVDCDMLVNNREALRHALCFFLDPKEGREVGYVQFPQMFRGITKNDVYANNNKRCFEIEFFGTNAHSGPMYAGTNSVTRRETLNGRNFTLDYRPTERNCLFSAGQSGRVNWEELEAKAREVTTCTYEIGKTWGKEMGMMYGCVVEDVYTGLTLHSKGWRSVCYNPEKRPAFLGLGPVNTNDTLIQHKRWSTGLMQIFTSDYCPWTHGVGRLKVGQILCYSFYTLWSIWCLPILVYATVPCLAMVNGISLFPKVSEPYFMVFVYLAMASHAYSLIELLVYGGTIKMWINETRMWMLKGTSSYLFTLIVLALNKLGIGETGFEITSKVMDEEARARYEDEVMDFGVASPMFVPFTVLSLLNLFGFVKAVSEVCNVVVGGGRGWRREECEGVVAQLCLSGLVTLVSLPLFEAMVLRRDKGRIPMSVTLVSLAVVAALLYFF